MGLIVSATLCIFLSIFLIPAASLQTMAQSSHSQENEALDVLHLVWLRKFRLLQEPTIKAHGFPVPKSNYKHQKQKPSAFNGKQQQREQNEMHAVAGGGTGRERVEFADMSSRLFTMDYARVRRRRPVHNMSLRRP